VVLPYRVPTSRRMMTSEHRDAWYANSRNQMHRPLSCPRSISALRGAAPIARGERRPQRFKAGSHHFRHQASRAVELLAGAQEDKGQMAPFRRQRTEHCCPTRVTPVIEPPFSADADRDKIRPSQRSKRGVGGPLLFRPQAEVAYPRIGPSSTRHRASRSALRSKLPVSRSTPSRRQNLPISTITECFRAFRRIPAHSDNSSHSRSGGPGN
jgi:hypothetical protein